MQHGVRIEAVFASLQQGEHMVESMQFPAYIQVILTRTIILQDRIISKEEEREDPRRELQSSFQLESKSVFTCNPAKRELQSTFQLKSKQCFHM